MDTQTTTKALVVRDPVCGMSVDPATNSHRAKHEGREFYFCSERCSDRFTADPSLFLDAEDPVCVG